MITLIYALDVYWDIVFMCIRPIIWLVSKAQALS